MACNVQCKYCMRFNGKIKEPKGFTPMMKAFLQQLNPKTTEAVVVNGGEPLLYLDRIKELHSLIDPNIHLTVMTNGTLITEKFVDWLNDINGELHFSHEGLGAKYLKGIDVLENDYIVKCLNKVKSMRLYNIITDCNYNVIANFNYIKSKLNNVYDMNFHICPMFAFNNNNYLINNFDFIKYQKNITEFYGLYPQESQNKHMTGGIHKLRGTNVLPNGDVVSIVTLKKYGTVLNTVEEIEEVMKQLGEYDFCINRKCHVRNYCITAPQCANEFTCKCVEIHAETMEYLSKYN